MFKYILKRVFWALITLLVILFVLFLLLEFMPGSPFNDERLSPEQINFLKTEYGMNEPFFIKFGIFLKNALKGDFGISYSVFKNQKVAALVLPRLGVSVRVGFQALVLGVLGGGILGLVSGNNQNTWKDTLSTVLAVIGVSIPSFVLALGLSYVVGYKWQLADITYNSGRPFMSTLLPTISLSMFVLAQVTRFLRTEFIEVMDTDFVKLARAKGLPKRKIISAHGIRNALISVVTIMGPLTVNLMTGSLVIERVFGIPGIGSLLVEAIQTNDYNVIIMIAFIYSVLYIVVNLAVDILYGVIDPRIRVAKGA